MNNTNTKKSMNFNQEAGFLLKKRNQYIYILVSYKRTFTSYLILQRSKKFSNVTNKF